MKKFLFTSLALLSMSAFSQSFIVLKNGVVLTTGADGVVYDLNNFILPKNITLTGGQFLIADKELITFYGNGFLFNPGVKANSNVKGKGLNYFIEGNELTTVNATGLVTTYKDKEGYFRKAEKFGGNFFVTDIDEKRKVANLVTVSDKGLYSRLTVPGLNPFTISTVGGTYFIANGVLYTVSNEGFVYPKPDFKFTQMKMMGGNFFIASAGEVSKIFTIASSGVVSLPALPISFNFKNIQRAGSNYMIDSEGRIFTVSQDGLVQESTHKALLGDVKFVSFK